MTQDLTNTVQTFFAAVDARDWPAAKTQMTTPFHLDYSSFGVDPAADLDPAEILAGWEAILPGFDATQHHLGPLNIAVDDDDAVVRTTVIATHQISGAKGGETWTVHGDYVLRLIKDGSWKLSAITLNFKFLTGNTELPAQAQARAAA